MAPRCRHFHKTLPSSKSRRLRGGTIPQSECVHPKIVGKIAKKQE